MTIKKNMQAERRKARLATRGQEQAVTSGSDTEESTPAPRKKRKKKTKQAAAPATKELEENKEGDNEIAIQETSSEFMPQQSDTDNETNETESTVTE